MAVCRNLFGRTTATSVMRPAEPLLLRLDAAELANLAWALARLRCAPLPPWQRAFEGAVLFHLESAPQPDISVDAATTRGSSSGGSSGGRNHGRSGDVHGQQDRPGVEVALGARLQACGMPCPCRPGCARLRAPCSLTKSQRPVHMPETQEHALIAAATATSGLLRCAGPEDCLGVALALALLDRCRRWSAYPRRPGSARPRASCSPIWSRHCSARARQTDDVLHTGGSGGG
jgi:hypothetical protein